jgi:hypothetical protein
MRLSEYFAVAISSVSAFFAPLRCTWVAAV